MLIILRKKEHLSAKMIKYFLFWFVGAFIFGAIECFTLKLKGDDDKVGPMDIGVAILLTLLSWVSIVVMFIAIGIDFCNYDPHEDEERKNDYEETV